jgi:DNA-binding GntR family transcriptional regulator
MTNSRSATLSETVADALRQALIDGVYVCGERLVELTIAQEMNVSQNTARDALRILEQQGWVTKRARHGVHVRFFTPQEAEELYALRGALEGLALGWALDRMQDDDSAALHSLIIEAQAQVEAHHLSAGREAMFAFHAALPRLAQRPNTADMIAMLHSHSRLLENLREAHAPRDRKQWRALLAEYAALVGLMAARDRDAAQAALQAILQRESKATLAVLDLL